MLQFDDTQLQKDLKSLRIKEEEETVQLRAQKISMPYVNLDGMSLSTDALALVDEDRAKALSVAGFHLVGQDLSLATLHESSDELDGLVQELTKAGYKVTLYLVSQNSLEKAWSRYDDLRMTHSSHGSFIDISQDALQAIVDQVKTNDDIKKLFDTVADEEENKRTSRLMEIIMGAAIATKSSDVHIEPQDEEVRLRYRQDGMLQDILHFDHRTYKQIMSRIKILSGMKLNLTKSAQDGRFTIDFNNVEIEIRVSTVPGPYGEGVVMRILDPAGINVGLEQLGIEPYLLDILKREVEKPHGLILNTGPTGSGKTTTLYSLLKYVYNPEIKILTIEDPIEYHLEGIHQTQVDHAQHYDFEAGLRAAMRQDPDIILVGEIRDNETALAAMQASQTGHLVLSTLHTNDASGAVPRLLGLKINPSVLGQSMSVALSQRLVRNLTDAKKKVKATPEQEKVMRAVLKKAQSNDKDIPGRFGLSYDMDEMWVYEPIPDEKSESGYKGRMGVFEAILIDDVIKDLLDKNPSDRQVKRAAQHQGILTMAEDGVVKILQGKTSYEEVERVVDLTADVAEELGIEGVTHQSSATTEDDLSAHKEDAPTVASPLPAVAPPKSSDPEKSLPAQELDLLVDYLKMLEDHQRNNPEQGIAQKITQVQSTIIELLKKNPLHDLFLQQTNEQRVEAEIDLLMNDLADLREHQQDKPSEGVAQQLEMIRKNIERLKKA
ncbi:Flp pilus assembly complex ATPase component TadA [Candidatus Nomurabacteria bacterium]|nr:Flp pilus assembly complex ATPase component TadA [Candidatus Nomurabacteria bacterium]